MIRRRTPLNDKAIHIPGQPSRQQRREAGRQMATELPQLIEELDRSFSWIHFRIDVIFESMRLIGASDEIFAQAEENVKARRKILANKAMTVPDVKQ
jgi:hypothetical protein